MPMESNDAMYDAIVEAQDEGRFEPTEWEEGFLETMKKVKEKGALESISERQAEALEKIYERL